MPQKRLLDGADAIAHAGMSCDTQLNWPLASVQCVHYQQLTPFLSEMGLWYYG